MVEMIFFKLQSHERASEINMKKTLLIIFSIFAALIIYPFATNYGQKQLGGTNYGGGQYDDSIILKTEALPEGNTGIASRYPDDIGIAADTDVIFADDFESYAK